MNLFTKPNKTDDPLWHSEDVRTHGGYVYSVSRQFSTVYANKRLSDAILSSFDYRGKRVVDIGCGDGVYTNELWSRGNPRELIGTDPAKEAIRLANEKYSKEGILFYDHSIYHLPWPDRYFDIAVVRGVIHHLDHPAEGVREAVRVSRKMVLTDPNGYNLGLKLIEKISPYHRAHREMSFFPFQYNRWLKEAGARILRDYYILIVPFFFPEPLARVLAKCEPFVERNFVLKRLCCSTHVRIAENVRFR